jgi:hypothetical protein
MSEITYLGQIIQRNTENILQLEFQSRHLQNNEVQSGTAYLSSNESGKLKVGGGDITLDDFLNNNHESIVIYNSSELTCSDIKNSKTTRPTTTARPTRPTTTARNNSTEDFSETTTSTPLENNSSCRKKLCSKNTILNIIIVALVILLIYLLFKKSNTDMTLGGLNRRYNPRNNSNLVLYEI